MWLAREKWGVSVLLCILSPSVQLDFIFNRAHYPLAQSKNKGFEAAARKMKNEHTRMKCKGVLL